MPLNFKRKNSKAQLKKAGDLNNGKARNVVSLESEIKKLAANLPRKGDHIVLPSFKSKQSIEEVRKNIKSKQKKLQENIEKLELIKEACTIHLDNNVKNQIIERGVTKRPIKSKRRGKKDQKTAFTEEDFAKFEKEYLFE